MLYKYEDTTTYSNLRNGVVVRKVCPAAGLAQRWICRVVVGNGKYFEGDSVICHEHNLHLAKKPLNE